MRPAAGPTSPPKRRAAMRAGLLAASVIVAVFGASTASAEPAVTPPAPPVIGPLQAGPPGYPPTAGVPLIPQARSGVAASVDALGPVFTPPASIPPTGIAGVAIGSGAVTPTPRQPG